MATTQFSCGRPAIAATIHTAERHIVPNDSTACRMRLHIASTGYGTYRPLRDSGDTPAPTPAADYPPRASHFPSGQRRHEVFCKHRGLVSLESNPEKQLKYFDFIDIYADLDDNERARYEREYPEGAEIMGTFSERYIQQGMEQGEQLGVRKGEAKVLLTLLQLKFGDVPESVRAPIDEADAETLLQWSTRVLTANSVDEVIADDR
ncbi:MAG: hypothetical protein U9Q81_19335 [Pseudomonadota bacterium]|nr:hypothetical protein [Pseudomonadota bacterium]